MSHVCLPLPFGVSLPQNRAAALVVSLWIRLGTTLPLTPLGLTTPFGP